MRFVMVVWFIMFIVVTIVNCYNTQLELSLYIKGGTSVLVLAGLS